MEEVLLQNNMNLMQKNSITVEKELGEKQNQFLETVLGKTINGAIDIGLRAVLPDLVESQVIQVKDTLLKEGLKEGIQTVVSSAIDMGKSAMGIFTGNFENISQVQTAVKKGGILDSASQLIDTVVNTSVKKDFINSNIGTLIKQGKNVLLDNINKNIENTLTKQISAAERLSKYEAQWKQYYEAQDFSGMEKEYQKIKTRIKRVNSN